MTDVTWTEQPDVLDTVPPRTVNMWITPCVEGGAITFQHACYDGYTLYVVKAELPDTYEVLETAPLTVIPGVVCERCGLYGMWVRDAWVPLTWEEE
jgi:hypothetical protein